MKRTLPKIALAILLLSLMLPAFWGGDVRAEPADWYDPDWAFRRPVDVSNPCDIGELTNFQVQVTLGSSFDFSKAKADGSDLRVTDFDGVTPIPFWIEEWDNAEPTASIWVKVPSIPTIGTTIYLYYGNTGVSSASDGDATFELFDDDWDLPEEWGNPVHTIAGEGAWVTDYVSYPNVFKEDDTYYMLYDGHTPHQKGLATSSDLITWTSLPDPVVTASGLTGAWDRDGVAWGDTIKVGDTYYMLVAGQAGSWRIGVETSTDLINWNRAPTGATNPVLVASETWEGGTGGSLSGTAVLKELDGITPVLHDGKYWIAYHDYSYYQIGLASADSPLGPWTKHTGNPILAPTETWESQGLWVCSLVREGDKYYIFYYGRSGNFHMGYASIDVADFPGESTDWDKTTSYLLDYGPSGSWDDTDHEDPVIRKFGETYYLFYTGKGTRYANGFATASAITGPFTKYGGSTPGKWNIGGSPEVTDGVLLLNDSRDWVESPETFGPGHAMGYRANFKGSANLYKWAGFIASSMPPFAYIGAVANVSVGDLILTTYDVPTLTRYFEDIQPVTDAFDIYEVGWLSDAVRGSLDHTVVETLTDAVPTSPLPVQFQNYNDNTYGLEVDWVYVRKYCGADATAVLGEEESPNQPPVADAGPDQTVEQTSHAGAEVTLDGLGSSDPDEDLLSFSWSAPGITFDDPTSTMPTATFPLGTTIVTLVVYDGFVDSDPDTVDITVEDTTPPEISVSISPDILWPPNHKMVEVTATVTVSDICDSSPTVVLTSVVSDEPDEANGKGDGKTVDDIQDADIGTEDYVFELRAERAGSGDGRTYTITYTVTDISGNSATAIAEVIVPHDKGEGKEIDK